jgi:hypothetical protein
MRNAPPPRWSGAPKRGTYFRSVIRYSAPGARLWSRAPAGISSHRSELSALATGQYSLAPHFTLILEQLREFVPEAAGRRLAIFRLPKVALCEGY